MSVSVARLTRRVRLLLADGGRGHARSRRRAWAVTRGESTLAPRPYITIRAGGPLQGVLTMTAIDPPLVVVEACWDGLDGRARISATRLGEGEALALVDLWTNQLIDGREPACDPLHAPGSG